MGARILSVFVVVLLLAGGAGGAEADGGTPRAQATLQCTAIDASTLEPIPVRVTITDSDGESRWPPPASTCFYHERAWFRCGYFYADGPFSLEVPTGLTVIGIGRGFEYEVVYETLDIKRDTVLVYELERQFDMDALDWYSGDCHSHRLHSGGIYDLSPWDMICIGRAEGLGVINSFDNESGFTGAPCVESTPDCILYISEEQRSSVLGHSGILGQTSLIYPFHSDWSPLIASIAAEVHQQPGAAIICAHPVTADDFFDLDSSWGATMLARELPVDLVVSQIDGFEVLSYSNLHNAGRELDLWYRILNCGFRIPGCAGTDACVNRIWDRPLGGFRTYVNIPSGGLDYDAWLSGLKVGRYFISNGPLMTAFDVDGLAAGESVDLPGDGPLDVAVHVEVESVFPLERGDIVVNGDVAASFFFEDGACSADTTINISLEGSSWVAARVFGELDEWFAIGDSLFAHSGPVYLTVDGQRIADRADAQYFVEWTDDLALLGSTRGEWETPADSVRFFDAVAEARSFYEVLAPPATTDVPQGEETLSVAPILLPATPNPFSGTTSIGVELPLGGDAVVEIFTSSGRLVRRIRRTGMGRGAHAVTWDGRDEGGSPVASGVYVCRVRANGRSATGKVALLR